MKVYIAAPWADRELAQAFARRCEDRGLVVTHKWWLDEEDPTQPALMRGHAERDKTGVALAEVVILLNTRLSEGKALEQGLAIAWGKPILAVGHMAPTNPFHYLNNYTWVPTTEDVWEALLCLA